MQSNALYYPQIGLNNPNLVKAMALYYDNVYRIVPNNVVPEDSPELQALLEEGSIGRMIDPAPYATASSGAFLSKLGGWGAAALTFGEEEENQISRIHSDKTDERVKELFRESGYKTTNEWLHVPTQIASNYMLYMANDIATKNSLSLMTSDWGAWTGSTYFGLDGQVDEFIQNIGKEDLIDQEANAFGLFGLMISELVPINISEVRSEDILAFRDRRKDEIALFRKAMGDLRAEISKLDALEIRVDAVYDKARELRRAQEAYKSSADIIKAKGWFGVSFMGVPAPLIFGKLLSVPMASTVSLGAAGLAIGGLFNIRNTQEELRRLAEKHPASYLVSLRSSFKNYTNARGGGDMNFHAFNCMEEYVND